MLSAIPLLSVAFGAFTCTSPTWKGPTLELVVIGLFAAIVERLAGRGYAQPPVPVPFHHRDCSLGAGYSCEVKPGGPWS